MWSESDIEYEPDSDDSQAELKRDLFKRRREEKEESFCTVACIAIVLCLLLPIFVVVRSKMAHYGSTWDRKEVVVQWADEADHVAIGDMPDEIQILEYAHEHLKKAIAEHAMGRCLNARKVASKVTHYEHQSEPMPVFVFVDYMQH